MKKGRMATPKPCSAKVMAVLASSHSQYMSQVNPLSSKADIIYLR